MTELKNLDRYSVEQTGIRGISSRAIDEETCLARVLDSFDLALSNQDISLTPHLVSGGFWEAWITSWFTKNVNEDTLVVDVGANCGYYTMLAQALGADAIACEPNPTYVELLKKTRDANKASFVVLNKAISDSKGSAVLSIPTQLHGSASITTNFDNTHWEHSNVEVKTDTLDNILKNFDREVLLKIDAEGAEEAVWRGMQKVVDSRWVVLLEYTPRAYSDEFLDELFSRGEVSLVNFSGEEELVSKDFIRAQTDWITLVVRNIGE